MRWIPLALVLLMSCNPFGCDEETETITVDSSGPFYTVELSILAGYRADGWDCDATGIDGSITLYTCTKCD